jgi:hypothetical protein
MAMVQINEEAKGFLFNTSSLQVKMFVHSNPMDAEKAIGHWLKQNDVSVHHITQSQSEKSGSFVFVVSVFFQQNN